MDPIWFEGRHSETDDVDAAHWTREHAADRIVAAAKIRQNFIKSSRARRNLW